MKKLLKEERPYEKCGRFGAESLTDIELLAVMLRSGTKGENALETARKILYPEGMQGGLSKLPSCSKETLKKVPGIGEVKAIQILCLCEMAKRIAKEKAKEPLCFDRPDTIAKYYMEDMRHLKQEELKLLMLNTKSRLIGETCITRGTVNMSVISPRELFIEALLKNAVMIILLHNHPSGDPQPSREDILVTKKIAKAGELIGVTLTDHIIIGDQSYVSLAEKGWI
nr:DNA repair protein RadC [uncultured Sellimonas sp.]